MICPNSTVYYPPIRHKIINRKLFRGWTLHCSFDKWDWEVVLYGKWQRVGDTEFPQYRKQIELLKFSRWNTLFGMTWCITFFDRITLYHPIARKIFGEARRKWESENRQIGSKS